MTYSGTPFSHHARPLSAGKDPISRSGRSLAFSLVAGVALTGLLGFGVAGCTSRPPAETAAAPPATQSRTAQSRTTSTSPGAAPVSPATQQSWNRVLNEWWSAWQKAQTKPAPAKKSPAPSALPLVTIDLGALAARHPAWQLARALEENRVTTLDFAALRAAGIEIPDLNAPSFDVRFDASASGSEVNATQSDSSTFAAEEAVTVPGYERGAETVTAQGLEALEALAGDRQSDDIENFLRLVAARQTDTREQYTQIRRAALENQVEVVRATPLPEIQPPLLSDEEQLKLTNLRLQLLRNIFTTDEERQKAQKQLDELLASWQARLRAQERERLAQLERQRVEEPRLAREEGEADLRRDLDLLRRQQRAVLEFVWQEHQRRVRQDFGEDTARLGITLPAAALPAQTLGAQTLGGRPPGGASTSTANTLTTIPQTIPNFIETNLPALSSQAAFPQFSAPRTPVIGSEAGRVTLEATGREVVIRALRAQAWREARKQARWAARRFGWRWQAASSKAALTQGIPAPDRTRQVLQWLSGESQPSL